MSHCHRGHRFPGTGVLVLSHNMGTKSNPCSSNYYLSRPKVFLKSNSEITSTTNYSSQIKRPIWTVNLSQLVKCLPNRQDALSWIPNTSMMCVCLPALSGSREISSSRSPSTTENETCQQKLKTKTKGIGGLHFFYSLCTKTSMIVSGVDSLE